MIPRTKIENTSTELTNALVRSGDRHSKHFREALAKRFSLPWPMLTSCASAAFYFILKALPNKKIYLPAYTCRALFEACFFAQRVDDVRLVDIDLDTFGVNLDTLAKVIEPGSILVAVHQYGIPADMDRFRAITNNKNGILVEDAAAAFGARLAGQEVGRFGDISLFSFDHTKTLSACGGGAIFFKDAALQREVESLARAEIGNRTALPLGPVMRGLAYNAATQNQVYGGATWPIWTWRNGSYQDHGTLRPDRFSIYRRPFGKSQALAGLQGLERIDGVLSRRKDVEARYLDRLKGHPLLATYRPLPGSETALVLFPIRVTRGDKTLFYRRCAALGIDLGFTFSYVNTLGHPIGNLEKAETAARQVLNLPFYSKLTDRQIVKVCEVVTEAI